MEEKRNWITMTQNQLITLIKNQGQYKKWFVELASDQVVINAKHIRPRKRKGDLVKKGITCIRHNVVLSFD